MKKVVLFLLAILIGGAAPVSAEYFTGEKVYSDCKAALELLDNEKIVADDVQKHMSGVCIGYIAGVVDFHDSLKSYGILPRPLYCMPKDTEIAQLVRTLVDYFSTHPKTLRSLGSSQALRAFIDTFPCTDSKPQK